MKSEFVKSVNASMNQILLCTEDSSDFEAFSSSIDSLKESKEKIIKEIEDLKIKDSYRCDNIEVFQKNLENLVSPVKETV